MKGRFFPRNEVLRVYKDKRLLVIIPAYNEAATIGDTIRAIPPYVDTVVVVDDGSADGTAAIAAEHGAFVRRHPRNRGVGSAFNTGIRAAREIDPDIVVNMDADGQFNPADIAKLVDPIVAGEADFVTASRFKDPSLTPKMSPVKYWGNLMMARLISSMAGMEFRDVSCGFRAYSREAIYNLNLFGKFTYTQESFLNFAFKDITILEVPVSVRGKRAHGKSRVASNLFRYTYYTTKIIVRTLRDYRPFRFFLAIALALFGVGLGFAIFLLGHYVHAGSFSPHKWAGFTAGFLALLATLSLVLGFVLDMFARMRINQEQILTELRKLRK
jgi:glycosyltransferase involved in cell wall biosynthesis